jgi:hypothetical protein
MLRASRSASSSVIPRKAGHTIPERRSGASADAATEKRFSGKQSRSCSTDHVTAAVIEISTIERLLSWLEDLNWLVWSFCNICMQYLLLRAYTTKAVVILGSRSTTSDIRSLFFLFMSLAKDLVFVVLALMPHIHPQTSIIGSYFLFRHGILAMSK